jgi:hypothetical protein
MRELTSDEIQSVSGGRIVYDIIKGAVGAGAYEAAKAGVSAAADYVATTSARGYSSGFYGSYGSYGVSVTGGGGATYQ